jgi:hypothetical protein
MANRFFAADLWILIGGQKLLTDNFWMVGKQEGDWVPFLFGRYVTARENR